MRRKDTHVILFLSFFMVISFLVPAFSAEEDSAIINYVEGLVFVRLPGERWIPAHKDMYVDERTAIETAQDSYCDLALDKSRKNIISLGPETEITIKEYLKKVEISRGRVFSLLAELPEGSSFEVKTPVASAGARGTAWETLVDITAKFNVLENVIYVKGVDKSGDVTEEQNVSAGNSIEVDEGGKLGKLTKLTDEDIERLKKWTQRIVERTTERDWRDVIERYEGESPNLFTEILQLEAEKDEDDSDEALEDSEGIIPVDDDSVPGIIGDEITPETLELDLPDDTSGSGSGSGTQGPTTR